MKYKTFLTGVLALSFLFAFSLVAFSQDDPNIAPPGGEFDGYDSTTEPAGSYATTQRIGNAPGMDEYRWFDEDFGWTHTFDIGCRTIKKAKLKIRAWDVDYAAGEIDKIYADGVYIGDLQGSSSTWSVTVFNIDPDLLLDGELDIWIDIDSMHDMAWWAVTIDWSKLRVVWDWLPPVLDFDTEVNLGVGELFLNFENLSQCFTDNIWEFGDGDSVSDLINPCRIYQPGSYDIILSVWGHEPWFGVPTLTREDFIVVYDLEQAPAELEIVDCSPSYRDEPWSAAIDKDIWYWNGTATVAADSPAYCIFGFADSSLHTIDKIRLLTDTGVGFHARWLRDFMLQVSKDGENFVTVLNTSMTKKTWSVEKEWNPNWESFSFDPVKTMYVKLVLLSPTDHWWIQVGEFEVWEEGKAPAVTLPKQQAEKPVESIEPTLPKDFALMQNHPNPFNPETDINFQIPEQAHVTLTIYNMRGSEVRTLVNENRQAGTHTVTWDGLDNSGNKVTSGVYIYRIAAGKFAATLKMVMLK